MADVSGSKSIKLAIYGIGGEGLPEHFVEADVFNKKVRAFITALKKADRRSNHTRPGHKFYISYLKTGSAEVGVTELPLATQQWVPTSSVETFLRVAEGVKIGDFKALTQYGDLAKAIYDVASGASRQYSHIDIVPEKVEETLRVDSFFESQAQRFVELAKEIQPEPPSLYSGSAHDAFDGSVKEVDLRGATWSGKLVLTGSGVEIDCTFKGPALEDVRKNLNMRVWAEGLAIYNGKSGLPRRLEVMRLRPISTAGDLRRWRGKLSPDEGEGEESDRLEQ